MLSVRVKRFVAVYFSMAMVSTGAGLAAEQIGEERDVSPHPQPEMERLIQELEQYEKLYENLDVTFQRTKTFHQNRTFFNQTVETIRAVWQPEIFFAERNSVHHVCDGSERTERRVDFYDGDKTTVIEYGNTVNVLHRRHHPAYVLRPHYWASCNSAMRWPLSSFLRGGDDIETLRKLHFVKHSNRSGQESPTSEAQYLGDEDFHGVKCAKVRLQAGEQNVRAPHFFLLWLSRDHNLLCAKWEYRVGEKFFLAKSQVDAFREITPEVFLPQKVSTTQYDSNEVVWGNQKILFEEVLLIKSAERDTTLHATDFAVDIPEELVVYEMSADHELIKSPHHPVPTEMPDTSTLEKVIAEVAAAEQNLTAFHLEYLEENHEVKDPQWRFGKCKTNGERNTEHAKLVRIDKQEYYSATMQTVDEDRRLSWTNTLQLIDGEILRKSVFDVTEDVVPQKQSTHLISLSNHEIHSGKCILWPHSLLTGKVFRDRQLSKLLLSSYNYSKGAATRQFEYAGDEFIDNELCHKIRRNVTLPSGEITRSQEFWISPNKGYMPVRSQWMSYREAATLPDSLHIVTAWHPPIDGVWIPAESVEIKFEESARREGNLVHEWQRRMTIEEFQLDPQVDAKLFRELIVPAHTQVEVFNPDGNRVFEFETRADGLLDLTPNQLQTIRGAKIHK